jgi:hypothetical protein
MVAGWPLMTVASMEVAAGEPEGEGRASSVTCERGREGMDG